MKSMRKAKERKNNYATNPRTIHVYIRYMLVIQCYYQYIRYNINTVTSHIRCLYWWPNTRNKSESTISLFHMTKYSARICIFVYNAMLLLFIYIRKLFKTRENINSSFIFTSFSQPLYFSVIAICSSIADPWFVFQLPEIDLRLKFKLFPGKTYLSNVYCL